MAKYAAFGTTLKKGAVAIAQVRDIDGPALDSNIIEATSHDDTDGYNTFVQGLKDAGEISLSIAYDPAGVTHKNASGGLLYEYEQGSISAYTLVFPDAGLTEWDFNALVKSFKPTAPVDGLLTADVTLKISGAPTLA
ncbi:MAG: hypothetical protein K1X65_25065 [Caldilineales bacterium]|nr:hypothetical protein [Caldilineales bacterium]